MLKTSLGMLEVLELPNGTQQVKFPPAGSFDIVIVESTPSDAIPDADPNDLGDPGDVARALLQAIADMSAPFERVRLAGLVVA